jgi:ABC-type amino acid transport substrate-binding protein
MNVQKIVALGVAALSVTLLSIPSLKAMTEFKVGVFIPAGGNPARASLINGVFSGFDSLLLCEVGKRAGINLNPQVTVFTDSASAIAAVESGAVDFVASTGLNVPVTPVDNVTFIVANAFTGGNPNIHGSGFVVSTTRTINGFTACELIETLADAIDGVVKPFPPIIKPGSFADLENQVAANPAFTAAEIADFKNTTTAPLTAQTHQLIPASCTSANSRLPIRNCISRFIFNKYCVDDAKACTFRGA